MTPRSFFIILIKLFGVYLIWEAFVVFFSLIPTIELAAQTEGSEYLYLTLLLSALTIGLLILIIRTCLYQPDRIINKLSLDKGFTEEKFDINPHRSTVLSIAIIITGLLLLVNSLPVLCQQFIVYIQQLGVSGPDTKGYLILHGMKTVAGYLMVTNNQRITAAIEQSRKRKPE